MRQHKHKTMLTAKKRQHCTPQPQSHWSQRRKPPSPCDNASHPRTANISWLHQLTWYRQLYCTDMDLLAISSIYKKTLARKEKVTDPAQHQAVFLQQKKHAFFFIHWLCLWSESVAIWCMYILLVHWYHRSLNTSSPFSRVWAKPCLHHLTRGCFLFFFLQCLHQCQP